MISKIIEQILFFIGGKVRIPIETEVRTLEVELPGVSPNLASKVDFKYLLVRYGNNELLEQDPSPEDKRRMTLRNESVDVKQQYDHENGLLRLKIPIKTHKTLSTEFKMYVNINDGCTNSIYNILKDDRECYDPQITDSDIENRIFFLLESLPETETPEGFTNNVLYTPESDNKVLFLRSD